MKKTPHLFPFCLLLFNLLFIAGCNKPYTPPEIVGTWNLSPESYQSFWVFGNPDAMLFYPELDEKIKDAMTIIEKTPKDPESITIEEDGHFKCKLVSGEIASGTWSQQNQVIYFYFTSGHYPEVDYLISETDGVNMFLYFSTLTMKPPFLELLDLNNDEYEILFGNEDPIITSVERQIVYTHWIY